MQLQQVGRAELRTRERTVKRRPRRRMKMKKEMSYLCICVYLRQKITKPSVERRRLQNGCF